MLRKVALITGASSGIGQGAALLFASKKCQISITGRNKANLEETKQQCIRAGLANDQILTSVGDITDDSFQAKLVAETVKAFGKLDVLVNSAGLLIGGATENGNVSDFNKLMDINVKSAVFLTKLCIPDLCSSKGSVVNVSAVAGPCAFPGLTFYCMSKAAIDSFTKCLALELAPKGVRVNAINPGVIVTDLHKRAGMDEATYKAFLEKSKETHALGRCGTTQEAAKAIAFLASDESSFTTGQLLAVDGGRGIMTPR